ncbi:hypothetical protein [Nostoc sp. C052]|nr:hypothetical protein [Nostoc sp. C052]
MLNFRSDRTPCPYQNRLKQFLHWALVLKKIARSHATLSPWWLLDIGD